MRRIMTGGGGETGRNCTIQVLIGQVNTGQHVQSKARSVWVKYVPICHT